MITKHLQQFWLSYFVLGVAAIVLPAKIAELPITNAILFGIGAVISTATVASFARFMKPYPAFGKARPPATGLRLHALATHLGMTIIMIASTLWSPFEMLVFNLALPLMYVGIFRLHQHLERTAPLDPMPWKGIAGSFGTFLSGTGVMALAMVV